MALILDVVSVVSLMCFIILVGVWCWVKWTNRHLIRAASNIHSIFPTLPILGCLHYAMFGIESEYNKYRSHSVVALRRWEGLILGLHLN